MSKATHAVIAIFVGLIIAGSMRSFGNPVRGVGDDVIVSLFSLAVVAAVIFGLWLAVSNLSGSGGGGGGGGGVSSQDLQQFEARVNAQFTQLGQAVTHVGADVTATNQLVTQVQTDVRSVLQGFQQWMPRLEGLLQTVEAATNTIGQGVQEIRQRVGELDNWRQNVWGQFETWIRQDVGDLLTEGRRMAVEIGHLRGEVQAVQTGQTAVEAGLVSLQRQQASLETEVRTGFTGVPAAVGADVQGRLDALGTVLSGEITASRQHLAGLVNTLSTNFGTFERDLYRRLAAANAAVQTDVHAMSTRVMRALLVLGRGQVDSAEAHARIEAAQLNMHQDLSQAFQNLPQRIVAVVQPEVARLEQAFTQRLDQVTTGQQSMQTVLASLTRDFATFENGLDSRLQRANAEVMQQVQTALTAVRDELTRELQALAQGQMRSNEAIARLEVLQQRLHQDITQALHELPPQIAQAMQPQIGRLEQALMQQMTQLRADQQATIAAVGDLKTETRTQAQVALAAMNAMQADLKQNLEAELAELAGAIANEIEPLTVEMRGISAQIVEVLQKIGAQGQTLDWLRDEEAIRHADLSGWIAQVHASLEKIDREGAKAAVLDDVHNDVGLIVDWCGQHGKTLEDLAKQLPTLTPLLEKLRELIALLEKKRKKANDAAGQVAKKQKRAGVFIGNARLDSVKYNADAITLFASLEVLRTYLDGPAVDAAKLKLAIPILDGARQGLCDGPKSSLALYKRVKLGYGEDPTLPLPPNLKFEGAFLLSLCETKDASGRVTKKSLGHLFKEIKDSMNSAQPNVQLIKDNIDKMKDHGTFKKVVERAPDTEKQKIRQELGI